jgi:aromatic-L-amino-acid/L-tryptophan decarboxylase
MTQDEFRKIGHQRVDWVADYRARVADLPVMARTPPGSVKAQLPTDPPENPDSWDAIFRDLDQVIVPGLSPWQHPRFFGYFPCNGLLSSDLVDYVSTGLGVLGSLLAVQSGPVRLTDSSTGTPQPDSAGGSARSINKAVRA